MGDKEMKERLQDAVLPIASAASNCCSSGSCCGDGVSEGEEGPWDIRVLNIEFPVIDMETCARYVPTGDQLEAAATLLSPVARAVKCNTVQTLIIMTYLPAESRLHRL